MPQLRVAPRPPSRRTELLPPAQRQNLIERNRQYLAQRPKNPQSALEELVTPGFGSLTPAQKAQLSRDLSNYVDFLGLGFLIENQVAQAEANLALEEILKCIETVMRKSSLSVEEKRDNLDSIIRAFNVIAATIKSTTQLKAESFGIESIDLCDFNDDDGVRRFESQSDVTFSQSNRDRLISCEPIVEPPPPPDEG